MNKDLVALDSLVNEYQEKEKSLSSLSSELELQSRQFATYIEQQKRQADELKLLKQEIHDYMETHHIREHDTGLVELKLVPMGKFKTDNIDIVPDGLCEVKKVLNNKKIKSYVELTGKLPEGVETLGDRLIMKVHDQ